MPLTLLSGFINNFLCWGGFIPLSKISYIIYLMHFTVIYLLESMMDYKVPGTNTFLVNYLPLKLTSMQSIFFSDHVVSVRYVLLHFGICCHLRMHWNALAKLWKAPLFFHLEAKITSFRRGKEMRKTYLPSLPSNGVPVSPKCNDLTGKWFFCVIIPPSQSQSLCPKWTIII